MDNYIPIREVARLFDMQTQYLSFYINGIGGYPNLGEGLRFDFPMKGNYHSYLIHADDFNEFVRRVKEHRVNR